MEALIAVFLTAIAGFIALELKDRRAREERRELYLQIQAPDVASVAMTEKMFPDQDEVLSVEYDNDEAFRDEIGELRQKDAAA